jgi:hypothetical protein
MKIVKTKDPNSIKFLNEKIQEYLTKEEIKEYDKRSFLKWLRFSITIPTTGVWICMDDTEPDNIKILGYIIVTTQQTLSSEHVFIVQLFGDTEEIEKDLLTTVEKWSKEIGINDIKTITLFPKKWKDKGFEVKEHLVTKEV